MEGKRNHKTITVLIFALMIFMAMAENTRGVFIPLFKDSFAINDTEIGTMLTLGSIGYMLSTYFGGTLCEKIGQKKVFLIGIATLALSLIVLSLSHSYLVFILGMILANCGLALSGIAANTVIPILFASIQTLIMNLVHFCYGLGSTIAQRTAGLLVYEGIHWRTIYFWVSLGCIALFAMFFMVKIPQVNKQKVDEKISFKEVLSNKLVLLYITGLGFYVFAEMGTGNWFINYMETSFGFDKSKSSFYLALFFGLFTFGRLVGGFVVEKFGYVNTVLKSLTIGIILYCTGLLLREKGVAIIALSGVFFSITFPTLVSTISKVFKSNSAYITGVVVTFASGVNMVMNLIIGVANDNFGARTAYYLVPISLGISIFSIFILNKNTKKTLYISKNQK